MRLNLAILKFTGRKFILFCLLISAFAGYASLGDGNSKKKKKASLLNYKPVTPGKFSLKSGYIYRGNQIINHQKSFNSVSLNSLITYQKGNMTYIVPMKTTVLTGKIKLSAGIPNLSRN